ncbi:branched-chain amino acid transport ATP-binding protein [Burkholderia pseudomallei]|uniref:DUF2278 family protein n=1 Tax=Burkholderia pseudomallei TaxID=28450 RepID=UPI0001722B88|nr:DUF2278 family protein [Burkholderia pseudomallei]EDS86597.1 conserved hypothetical protein [Burkholderia pseudomallei S13]MBF3439881.1 DUF2278 family protein [Burkholderia pseudomallei]MBF3464433.1 DUF2278 family protein [Burkholderia pseudomallei]CAJ3840489.1 branched-chain amino acid transport ATP-binding protein [Burkholderia pseudomallei]CAJ4601987.1 branched-chain amino acid transport ATP-binding protein [Burkholderia pseudomallei]
MGQINYSYLKGKIDRFKPAPTGNPHLWMLVDVGSDTVFATVNVQSSKGLPNMPVAESYLDFFVNEDFRHPISNRLRGLAPGLHPQERSFSEGALDYIKGNLFDPRKMRVLPSQSAGGDDLVHRLEALLGVAREQNDDIVIVGSQFQTSPGQTNSVFGETPAFGIDNTHMAQGDPREIDAKLHENGAWHDGAIFLLSANTNRVTAIFLAFQTQAWQTDENGQAMDGTTGFEAPRYDFAGGGLGNIVPAPAPLAEFTSLNRLPDGTGRLVIANMSASPLDISGWVVTTPIASKDLPATTVQPGQPLSIDLDSSLIFDTGGILSLLNDRGLKVDGVAYLGGPATGWSTSFIV